MTTSQTVPALGDDPFGSEILTDPYEFHARLREAAPVVHLPRYDLLAMGRYAEVRATLSDWETFVSSRGVGLSDFGREKPWRPPSLLLEADPPDHTVVRTAMNGVISPRNVRKLRAEFAAAADELADTLVARGRFDAVTDLAEIFPVRVFGDAVGLPAQGRENLLPYGALAFNAFGPRNQLLTDALAKAAPVQEWILAHCQRDELTPDGLGAEVWAAADRGEITHEQAPLLVRSLLTAGLDTTVYGLGNTLYALARHPEQWAALHADPKLAKFAFDEALRWEAPIQTFFRTAAADAVVAGIPIPKDTKVVLFLGSANRDSRHWGDDAETFDVRRSAGGHVAFGMGIHQCVGQPIARLEAEVVLGAFASRAARLELDGEPVPKLNNTLKGWASIPVRVTAA
ncbi:cytochrome P450 [Pseudonocardia xinjiangensis]|uniref:Cytochrome P450 n=1 Tax=Pseudonocardia xinjiangensis TaxID=75289 RepID=A0ABX1RJG5_9PSEU|nr:cytochrome P450 [Pseudonocardia xinjiangensis]NMH80122.1 cytochrome P450 [Pseudonocardia xinjiangensis]